jgi:inner membrane protein
MPTVMTHAVVGLGMAAVASSRPTPWSFWALSAGLSMLPDLDIVAFRFGIPYGAPFGHRGFSHSLGCAVLVGLIATGFTVQNLDWAWWKLWGYWTLVTGSHGILDTFTNGGKGIAIFAPVEWGRHFAPWQPIEVSPIGIGFFSVWGARALLSEVFWIWLPVIWVTAAVWLYRAGK